MQPKDVCLYLLATLMFTSTGCALPHNHPRSPVPPAAGHFALPPIGVLIHEVDTHTGELKANAGQIEANAPQPLPGSERCPAVVHCPAGKITNLQFAMKLKGLRQIQRVHGKSHCASNQL
ncbi:hypothetical protein BDP27DRAFT_1410981 [Rhodocollybia butyracea]|uniref:Uncharacterized protein n=1 Tax=Rhodocollybia butyracea TaxID=206335 RepID=A0A9P5P4M2_9AGAR|nr:hypothetical protein BDP27DRAFT_1410981 [Rhodocollybia butyracea]